MLGTILGWLTGGVIGAFTKPLVQAYEARLKAQNDSERLAADQAIKSIEAARDIAVIEAADRLSATRVGRWLIVVPFGLWWSAIYLVQIVNPWFGWSLTVIDVPGHIHDMAQILVPAIVLADAGALAARRLRK